MQAQGDCSREQSPCACIRNALIYNSSGHKEPQSSDFSNHLMLTVMIGSCPNLVVGLKASVELKNVSRAYVQISCTPYFKSWIHPCPPSVAAHAAGHIVPQLMYWSDQLPLLGPASGPFLFHSPHFSCHKVPPHPNTHNIYLLVNLISTHTYRGWQTV